MNKKEKRVKIGIIGCGSISQAYLDAAKNFDSIEITACSDLNRELADQKARENNIIPVPLEEIFNSELTDIILNLTPPSAHAEINLKAIDAGKHVYSEKPFTADLEEAKMIVDKAEKNGLLTGCAPDTFLGGGLQTCRKLIDDGTIGEVTSGTAFMMCHGHESWHPNPGFFYKKGAGPMFDMGPYYISALVNLIGPVKKVIAATGRALEERTATSQAAAGKTITVEVPTHYTGVLEFSSKALISITMSFDVWAHQHSNPIELYGTEGSLAVPDPNSFGGPVKIKFPGREEWDEAPLSHIYTDNMRSIGVADMACALKTGRRQRCSGRLALHVLEVMHAFEKSSQSGTAVEIESRCERPEALPAGLAIGALETKM